MGATNKGHNMNDIAFFERLDQFLDCRTGSNIIFCFPFYFFRWCLALEVRLYVERNWIQVSKIMSSIKKTFQPITLLNVYCISHFYISFFLHAQILMLWGTFLWPYQTIKLPQCKGKPTVRCWIAFVSVAHIGVVCIANISGSLANIVRRLPAHLRTI